MIQGVIDQFRVAGRLMTDPRVPLWTKAVPVLAVLYVLSPLDLIPDFMPGLGQLDDIGIILAGLRLFESLAPNPVVKEHRKRV